jgi:hypothetical protein
MPIDKIKKSNRLLASRRYTNESLNDNQEAFTRVLDLNASEIYIQQNVIPTSSLPYSGSSQDQLFITSGSENILKYYYQFRLTPSSTNTEVYFFISKSGHDPTVGVTSQIIQDGQQGSFISPKYSNPSLTNFNTEDNPPGYNIVIKVDGISQNPANYQFDYKTGVLQFSASAPSPGANVSASVYQYVGKTLDNFITSASSGGSGTGFPFSGSAVITGSLLISGSGTIDELVVSGNVIATQGFTGSLFGTASWANNAASATSALTASYVNPLTQSVFISGGIDIYLSNSWDIYTGQYVIGNGDVPLAPIAITGSGLIISASDLPTSVYNFLKIGNTEIVSVDNAFAGNSLLIHNVDSFQVTSGSDGGTIKTLFYHNGDTFNIYTGGSSSPLASFSTSSVTISPTNGTSLTTPVSINAEYLESFQYGVAVFETDDSSNPSVIRRASNSKFIFTTGSTLGQTISGSGNIHALRILGGSGSISALIVTGGLSVNGGITGSLLGTASWAITASHALNAIYTAGGGLSLASNIFSVNYGAAPNIITSANGLDGSASPTSDQIMFYHSGEDEVQTTNIGNFLSRYAGISSYANNTTTLNGNLVVNGTASFFGSSSFINVQNLAIEDKFILLNSGSKGTPSHEGGIIIQTSASADNTFGTAIFYDQDTNRWMVARSSSVAANATSIAVGATTDYIVTVSASVGAPTGAPVNFGDGGVGNYSLGQMYIQTNTSDIYIYA